MSPGLVEYHAARLMDEQLLASNQSHYYCITIKGRDYVVEKGLIGH